MIGLVVDQQMRMAAAGRWRRDRNAVGQRCGRFVDFRQAAGQHGALPTGGADLRRAVAHLPGVEAHAVAAHHVDAVGKGRAAHAAHFTGLVVRGQELADAQLALRHRHRVGERDTGQFGTGEQPAAHVGRAAAGAHAIGLVVVENDRRVPDVGLRHGQRVGQGRATHRSHAVGHVGVQHGIEVADVAFGNQRAVGAGPPGQLERTDGPQQHVALAPDRPDVAGAVAQHVDARGVQQMPHIAPGHQRHVGRGRSAHGLHRAGELVAQHGQEGVVGVHRAQPGAVGLGHRNQLQTPRQVAHDAGLAAGGPDHRLRTVAVHDDPRFAVNDGARIRLDPAEAVQMDFLRGGALREGHGERAGQGDAARPRARNPWNQHNLPRLSLLRRRHRFSHLLPLFCASARAPVHRTDLQPGQAPPRRNCMRTRRPASPRGLQPPRHAVS